MAFPFHAFFDAKNARTLLLCHLDAGASIAFVPGEIAVPEDLAAIEGNELLLVHPKVVAYSSIRPIPCQLWHGRDSNMLESSVVAGLVTAAHAPLKR